MTVGPNDLLYIPAGICFAERVSVSTGDVFGLRVPLIACDFDTNLSVMKRLHDSYIAKDDASEMSGRYGAVFETASKKLAELRAADVAELLALAAESTGRGEGAPQDAAAESEKRSVEFCD